MTSHNWDSFENIDPILARKLLICLSTLFLLLTHEVVSVQAEAKFKQVVKFCID